MLYVILDLPSGAMVLDLKRKSEWKLFRDLTTYIKRDENDHIKTYHSKKLAEIEAY